MQKAWQALTFVHFGQKRSGQDGRAGGGGTCDGLRRGGFWRNSGGSFLTVKAAGGCKTVAGAYFRSRGACSQYDPKVILGAKNPRP